MWGKSILVFLLVVACNYPGISQNLVSNPGFEDLNNCPTDWAQIGFSSGYSNFPTVKDWANPLEETTPDYFNTCATFASHVNIPNTFLGYHTAHEGNACAGIIAYHDNVNGEYREYIEVKLKEKMIQGHRYEVSFYVSTSYDPAITSNNYIGIDRVGVVFTNSFINDDQARWLTNEYGMVNAAGNHITGVNTWVKIEGIYVANGGEEWMTIGSFKNNTAPFTAVQVYPAVKDPNSQDYSYLYIDDVFVKDLDQVFTFTNRYDTAVCVAAGMVLTSPVSAGSYLWNTGATTQSIILADSGLYWCKAKNGNTEYIDTFSVRRLYFYKKLDIGSDTLICKEDNFILGNDFPLVTYYSWSTGSNECCITPSTGTYSLTISNGCDVISDTINITAVSCQSCFFAPNAFTPNSDGKNDRFGVFPQCLLRSAAFKIFDRWGTEVFSTQDLTKKWDGTLNGRPAPTDTYFYMVEYELLADKPKQVFKGDVILIR